GGTGARSGVASVRTYGGQPGTRRGSTLADLPSPTRLSTQPRNRPPALLAPPIWHFPPAMCGMVHRPGTSLGWVMVTQTISVVPHSTSTSPSWSAPATSCSDRASIAPAASTVSVPDTWPTAAPIIWTLGMRSTGTPRSAQAAGLQPLPSNSGKAVPAVAMSITASPASAWFAPAGAGQYPAASGASSAVHRRNSAVSPVRKSPLRAAAVRPRLSPYSRPGVIGLPTGSTAVSDGTIAET